MWQSFFKSKLVIAGGVVVLGLTIYSLSRELTKRYEIRKEIQHLQTQIDTYQSKNDEMLKLINYFKTPAYQERQARSLLNLQRPGEFAVALPPDPPDNSASAVLLNGSAENNLRLWWNYFFAH